MPTLTTIIPVHNGMPYLRECLESVNGTRCYDYKTSPARVVVFDNASTDGTAELLKPYAHYGSKEKLPIYESHNWAVQCARSNHYHILHADDEISPRFYEVMLRSMELHITSKTEFAMAWCEHENLAMDETKVIDHRIRDDYRIDLVSHGQYLRDRVLMRGNQLLSTTVFYSRDWKALPKFDASLEYAGDQLFLAEFAMKCQRLIRVNRCLVKYRIHSKQAGQTVEDKKRKDETHRVPRMIARLNGSPVLHALATLKQWKQRIRG
jgi:glycosyltransferase involved in cell wall biosynthesis